MRSLFSPLLTHTVNRSCELCCPPSVLHLHVGSKIDDTAGSEVVVGQSQSHLISSSLSRYPSSLNVCLSSLIEFVCFDFSWWFSCFTFEQHPCFCGGLVSQTSIRISFWPLMSLTRTCTCRKCFSFNKSFNCRTLQNNWAWCGLRRNGAHLFSLLSIWLHK